MIPTDKTGNKAHPDSTSVLELPANDTRTYKHIALSKEGSSNSSKLHVLLISDPNTDKASAACDVGIGQLNDPEKFPGLAHFCEHMVFIGNKKYPTENAYDKYLSNHGGMSNAFTDLEHTCYYFDVQLPKRGNEEDVTGEEPVTDVESNDKIEAKESSGDESEQLSTFEGALDRFAHCLIDPLFTASAVAREVRAVDSEHSKNMQQDLWRLHQLSRNLLAPSHPYAAFGTGNAKSLHAPELTTNGDPSNNVKKTEAENSSVDEVLSPESSELRDELVSFFHKFYRKSLSLYKLAVVSNDSIQDLEAMVCRIFGKLVEKTFADDSQSDDADGADDGHSAADNLDSYRPAKLLHELFPTILDYLNVPQRVHVVPISQTHTVELQFPMRELQTLYRSKPGHYLSHLFGHEGTGSLLSALKEKHFAQDLYADGSSRHGLGWSIFSIHIDLTELGLGNVNEVIRMVFAYLDVLRSMGRPVEWIQEELTTVSDLRFKFLSKRQPIEETSSIVGWMQLYPPSHYISGTYKVYEFNPDAIMECWESIRPDNMLVIVSSPIFESGPNGAEGIDNAAPATGMLTDPNYGTPYKLVDLTHDELRQWADTKSTDYPQLQLPERNDMIATNFELSKFDDTIPKNQPRCIVDSNVCRLWYKPDTSFSMPKVNALFMLRSNYAYSHSPETYILTQIWASVLHEKCNEFTYLASMAGLHCEVTAATSGVELSVSGYNHKAHILLQRIIDTAATTPKDYDSWISAELFDRLHDKLSKQFSEFLVAQPYQHAMHVVDSCLEAVHWGIYEKIKALEKVTRDDLVQFAHSRVLWKQCRLEGLVHGNMSAADAKKLSSIILEKLKPLAGNHPVEHRVVQLTLPSAYKYQLVEFNDSNLNSCVEMLFQVGPVDYPQNAVLSMLAHLIREPAYNQLRTEEQLGYIVHSAIKTSSSSIKSLLILVQSQSHDPLHVEARIEAFLVMFRNKLVAMDEEEYQKNIDAVVSSFLEKDKNLGEESSKYWHVISAQTYRFTRMEEIAKLVQTTTKSKVIQFFDRYIAKSSPHRRKLCIQVFAKQHQDRMGCSIDDGEVMIADPTEFKRCMPLFPLEPRAKVHVLSVDDSEPALAE